MCARPRRDERSVYEGSARAAEAGDLIEHAPPDRRSNSKVRPASPVPSCEQLSSPRYVLGAYTLIGFVVGAAISVWLFRDGVNRTCRHADGSLSGSSDRQVWEYDIRSGKHVTVRVSDGRPLTIVEKIVVGARASFLLWMSSAVVGLVWGLVHLRLRADLSNPRDQNRLDYGDSITSNLPPGST